MKEEVAQCISNWRLEDLDGIPLQCVAPLSALTLYDQPTSTSPVGTESYGNVEMVIYMLSMF